MKIEVKQEHIDNGTRENSNCCPVALAIKEQVPGVVHNSVDVETFSIGFKVGDKFHVIESSDAVSEFIEAFDFGEKDLHTFAFELDLNEGSAL